jgi:Cdc6-like AAA superfamily ATPase
MVAIIDKRLESARSLADVSAVKFAAKRASKVSGDVRQVLNIVKLAFTKCLDEISSEVAEKTVDGNIYVKLRHVMIALKESGAVPLATTICHLPQACKSVLCIAVALQSCIPPRSQLTLAMLKKYCAEASSHNVVTLENTSNETYVDILRQLEDSGLFHVGGSDMFFNSMNIDPTQLQLSIQCGMDDVECAMGEALFNQPFYKNMFDHIRKSMQ